MKKILFAILTILALTLTACSTSSTGTPIGSTTSNVLPVVTQLAVGTLKLAGTDQAVTAEQARDLLIYWETYKQLMQSDTAAQEEVNGLAAQIQETMTDEQMKAIDEMDITQQDVFASMQGVTVPVGNASDSTVSVPSGGAAGGSGMPAGGPPSDGGSAPPDGGMGGDMAGAAPASGTDQAQNTQTGSSTVAASGIPTALIEAVIQSLQQIIAA
jgi:hypothetical protein